MSHFGIVFVGRQQEGEADGWWLHYLGLSTKKNKHEEKGVRCHTEIHNILESWD